MESIQDVAAGLWWIPVLFVVWLSLVAWAFWRFPATRNPRDLPEDVPEGPGEIYVEHRHHVDVDVEHHHQMEVVHHHLEMRTDEPPLVIEGEVIEDERADR